MFFYRVFHVKKILIPLICVLFILLLILFSEDSLESARNGISLWLNTVFPSLLPFLVISEMLRNTGFINRLGRILEPVMKPVFNLPGISSFAWILGIASGYPTGAKITSGMYRDGLLTKNEAERLLAISNNAGPLFITGVVATGIFRIPGLGILMLLCHIISGFFSGILVSGLISGRKKTASRYFSRIKISGFDAQSRQNPGISFVNAVSSSVNTLLMVGGFIIFFSVVISMLLATGIVEILTSFSEPLFLLVSIPANLVESFIIGVIEITTGINMLGGTTLVPLETKIALASFLMGLGGISVCFQVYGIASEAGIGIGKYIIGKTVHAVLSFFITLTALKLYFPGRASILPAFSPYYQPSLHDFPTFLLVSIMYMVIALAVISSFLLISGLKKHTGVK